MHYSLIVAVPDGFLLEGIMEPFCQEYDGITPHFGQEITDQEKSEMLEYYKETDIDKCYEKNGEDWNCGYWKKDSRGVWREWITYNEDGFWDWYEVGGRWPGKFKLIPDAESKPSVSFSWGWNTDEQEKFSQDNPMATDRAKKKDIANLQDVSAYAVLIDGEYIELGNNESAWDYLKDINDDVELVCVDYHN